MLTPKELIGKIPLIAFKDSIDIQDPKLFKSYQLIDEGKTAIFAYFSASMTGILDDKNFRNLPSSVEHIVLVVFETLTIDSNFTKPVSFTIMAQHIVVRDKSTFNLSIPGQPASLGKAAHGQNGKHGKHGAPAGRFFMGFETCTDGNGNVIRNVNHPDNVRFGNKECHLDIIAIGQKGGSGQDAYDGLKGRDGDNASIETMRTDVLNKFWSDYTCHWPGHDYSGTHPRSFNSAWHAADAYEDLGDENYQHCIEKKKHKFVNYGQYGAQGGASGTRGKGGAGGKASGITIHCVKDVSPMVDTVGRKGPDGEPGACGVGGQGGQGGKNAVCRPDFAYIPDTSDAGAAIFFTAGGIINVMNDINHYLKDKASVTHEDSKRNGASGRVITAIHSEVGDTPTSIPNISLREAQALYLLAFVSLQSEFKRFSFETIRSLWSDHGACKRPREESLSPTPSPSFHDPPLTISDQEFGDLLRWSQTAYEEIFQAQKPSASGDDVAVPSSDAMLFDKITTLLEPLMVARRLIHDKIPQNQKLICVHGKSGAGKSTFSLDMLGVRLQIRLEDGYMVRVEPRNAEEAPFRVGHNAESETILPTAHYGEKPGFWLCDLAGVPDNRGAMYQLVIYLIFQMVLRRPHCWTVHFNVTDNVRDRKNLWDALRQPYRRPENTLVVLKCSNPRLTASQLLERLLKNSDGLDSEFKNAVYFPQASELDFDENDPEASKFVNPYRDDTLQLLDELTPTMFTNEITEGQPSDAIVAIMYVKDVVMKYLQIRLASIVAEGMQSAVVPFENWERMKDIIGSTDKLSLAEATSRMAYLGFNIQGLEEWVKVMDVLEQFVETEENLKHTLQNWATKC